jgi:hypothetical protein
MFKFNNHILIVTECQTVKKTKQLNETDGRVNVY